MGLVSLITTWLQKHGKLPFQRKNFDGPMAVMSTEIKNILFWVSFQDPACSPVGKMIPWTSKVAGSYVNALQLNLCGNLRRRLWMLCVLKSWLVSPICCAWYVHQRLWVGSQCSCVNALYNKDHEATCTIQVLVCSGYRRSLSDSYNFTWCWRGFTPLGIHPLHYCLSTACKTG